MLFIYLLLIYAQLLNLEIYIFVFIAQKCYYFYHLSYKKIVNKLKDVFLISYAKYKMVRRALFNFALQLDGKYNLMNF